MVSTSVRRGRTVSCRRHPFPSLRPSPPRPRRRPRPSRPYLRISLPKSPPPPATTFDPSQASRENYRNPYSAWRRFSARCSPRTRADYSTRLRIARNRSLRNASERIPRARMIPAVASETDPTEATREPRASRRKRVEEASFPGNHRPSELRPSGSVAGYPLQAWHS